MSELFRIIIFVSERHPRGSKLKLSFLAIVGREGGGEGGRGTRRDVRKDVARETEMGLGGLRLRADRFSVAASQASVLCP